MDMGRDHGTGGNEAGTLASFDEHRPLLFSIAYRMLGSVSDAEDVLQEAFVRWQRVDGAKVRSPKAYLSAAVTRLCIDRLRSAEARREAYVGPWLSEPLAAGPESDAAAEAVLLEESLSMSFLVLLESLSPTERAVFLLREVFDYEYEEISRIVGKSEANCRQIARRARQAVAAGRPRFESSPEHERRLVEGFLEVCLSGDMDGLICLLSEDAVLYADGGGKTRAALNPIRGADNIARFFSGVLGKAPPDLVVRRTPVNGRPGFVAYFGDGTPQSATTFEISAGSIQAIRLVVNPDELGGISPLGEVER